MPLAFYLDFATKQEGLRRFIDSKGLLSPRIVSLSCRPLPPSDNKGKDLAVIKQFFTDIFYQSAKLESPGLFRSENRHLVYPQENCLTMAKIQTYSDKTKLITRNDQ